MELSDFAFVWQPQEQAEHGQEDEAAIAARRLARQTRASAFVKRAIILHGGKLVALAAWWAGAQRPGAIGWVFTGVPQKSMQLVCLPTVLRAVLR